MGIKATIIIDDDRWAKHPYGVNLMMRNVVRSFIQTVWIVENSVIELLIERE